MYKILEFINNNIKESDIIKTFGNMISFMSGVGICLLYKKYEKDIINYMDKMTKTLKEEK